MTPEKALSKALQMRGLEAPIEWISAVSVRMVDAAKLVNKTLQELGQNEEAAAAFGIKRRTPQVNASIVLAHALVDGGGPANGFEKIGYSNGCDHAAGNFLCALGIKNCN